ncbi:Uncharacterised protein [Candidatus Gugararchaeum adminiculabundum]|nr:Uncharacterised protein [Candidatus Gugararchaeum adminiculabundum]
MAKKAKKPAKKPAKAKKGKKVADVHGSHMATGEQLIAQELNKSIMEDSLLLAGADRGPLGTIEEQDIEERLSRLAEKKRRLKEYL